MSIKRKIIPFPVLVILIFLFANCKKEFKPVPGNDLISYNAYGLINIYEVLKSSTGDIYMFGDDEKTSIYTLIKTNAAGNVLWKKNIESIYVFGPSLIEKEDGTFLLIADKMSNTAFSIGTEIKIYKFNADGVILKETTFTAAPRDTFTSLHTDNNFYQKKVTSDGAGGYYFISKLEFEFIGDPIIAHYNNKDSIDNIIDLGEADSRFWGLIPEYVSISTNPKGDLVISYLGFDNLMEVERLDKAQFKLNNIDSLWASGIPVEPQNYQSCTVMDNGFVYCAIPLITPEKTYTFGVQIFKIELGTGTRVKEWTIPLRVFTGRFHALTIGSLMLDDNNIYCQVSIGDDQGTPVDGFVLKSSKEGTDQWVTQVGGNISRDFIYSSHLFGDEIFISGKTSNNRGVEASSFLCQLDKSGKFIHK